MRVLVLSAATSVLEDELVRQARDSGTPMPLVCLTDPALTARRRQGQLPYELCAVPHWRDVNALRRLAATLDGTVDAVATIHEGALQAAAVLRAYLGLDGPDLATAVAFTDKHVQKKLLAEVGVPVAAHRVGYRSGDVLTAAAELGYPLIVKHRNGFNSVNTYIITSPADLSALNERDAFTHALDAPRALSAEVAHTGLATGDSGFMIEECVPVAAEYHCEILAVAGVISYAIVGRYSQPCLQENAAGYAGGVLLDPQSPTAQAVRDLALEAALALGLWDGTAHAEVFETIDGLFKIGEVGARPGGLGIQPTIGHAYTGINLPAILAAQARGEQPTVRPVRNDGIFGWSAALSRPEILRTIADPAELCADSQVLDAEVRQEPGTWGEPGSMPVAFAFLRTDTEAQMVTAVDAAPTRFGIAWTSVPNLEEAIR